MTRVARVDLGFDYVTTIAPFGNHVSMNRDRTLFYGVTPSYFSTLRIPLRSAGRQRPGLIDRVLPVRRWN